MAPDAVAERRGLVFTAAAAAGDAEGRLAVDEVQAALGDDDLVVLQLQVALGEGLTLAGQPLQLAALCGLTAVEDPRCEGEEGE